MPVTYDVTLAGPTKRDLWRGRRLVLHDRSSKMLYAAVLLVFGGAGAAIGAVFGNWSGLLSPPVSGTVVALGAMTAGLWLLADAVQHLSNQAREAHPLANFRGLERQGLEYRLATRLDAEAYANSIDDKVVAENGWPESMAEDSLLSLACGFTDGQMVAITNADSGNVVGFAGLDRLHRDGQPEAGLWLTPEARGAGFGHRVVSALGEIAESAGYHTVWFGTRATNSAMRRSCDRGGAVEAYRTPHNLPNGEFVPSVWHKLTCGPTSTRPRTD